LVLNLKTAKSHQKTTNATKVLSSKQLHGRRRPRTKISNRKMQILTSIANLRIKTLQRNLETLKEHKNLILYKSVNQKSSNHSALML